MTPVEYSPASQAIVKAFEAVPEENQSASYWSNDEVEPVRAEIKDHYILEQLYHCVYCARQIVTANKALWDAEHVISRSKASRFMFTPRNLAVSCRDCNNAKGDKEIRSNPKRKSFPDGSGHYLIVHPHYDTYADHIRWFGDICAPLSEKGTETLVVCNLTRFTAKLLGIKGIISDPSFDEQVGQLIKAKSKLEALSRIAAITVYVENIPQK
ncbi:HNH endonuclease [Mesorhizobium sp. M0715]|uniref:HNH endonuclease n=1 Tax=Mesorhizobium sp. M0715 TaxID=2956990 RepID=UPI00333C5FC0